MIVDCGIAEDVATDMALSSDISDKKKHKHKKKDSKRKKSKKRDRRYSSDECTSEESYDDDDRDERGRKYDRERRRKKSSRSRRHSKKKSRRSYSDSDDSFSSEEESSEHSRKRRKSRKEKRRYYSSEESDYSDQRRKERKRDHKSKKKKRKKEYPEDAKEAKPISATTMTFGMYGIIRDTDFMTSSKVKRSFERWMEEVKGVPQGANVPKWEVTNFMKEYAEDFNTATLPHEKYYDYDKWEMDEFNKRKEESKRKKGALSDEIEYQEELKKKAEEKRRREFEMVKSMMSKDRIDEMKKQSRLRAELQNAYRVGDEETRKRLQKKLEPEQK